MPEHNRIWRKAREIYNSTQATGRVYVGLSNKWTLSFNAKDWPSFTDSQYLSDWNHSWQISWRISIFQKAVTGHEPLLILRHNWSSEGIVRSSIIQQPHKVITTTGTWPTRKQVALFYPLPLWWFLQIRLTKDVTWQGYECRCHGRFIEQW